MWKRDESANLAVRHRIFESQSKSWDVLCQEATAFATQVGRQNLINISVGASGGTELFGHGGRGVIVVWYWE